MSGSTSVQDGEDSGARGATDQRSRLIDAGLLVRTGIDGLYGLSSGFQSIVEGLDQLLRRVATDDGSTGISFPPVMVRADSEREGYPKSFPQLIGAVHTFDGSDRDHARLIQDLNSGADWMGAFTPSEVVMCPAACHPLYPTLSGQLPPGGTKWHLCGWVFRHEPSLDPARLQAFRQWEFIYVGDDEGASFHTRLWGERALEILGGLGLDVRKVPANDPFFGRVGSLLATSQREAGWKEEIIAPTSEIGPETAIASVNHHQTHFGQAFSVSTSAGSPATSACSGYGLERIALALIWRHGMDLGRWPADVRRTLW